VKVSTISVTGRLQEWKKKEAKISCLCNFKAGVFRLKVDAEHLKVEEDKLKIIWHAAGIEKWLLGIHVI
jgi:hypothetical protein